jgi:AcrR family transcriptional regulator
VRHHHADHAGAAAIEALGARPRGRHRSFFPLITLFSITTLSFWLMAVATSVRTRDALVAAAARVFLARGFQGASLREIASEAGLTTGAVYSNFEGKADLFLAVLEEKIDPRLAVMYEAARTAPRRRLGAAVGEELAAYVRQQRRWLTLLIEFWAQAARDPKLRPKFAERHSKLRSAITGVLTERADRLGLSLALPADQLATVVIALTNGIAVERLADPHAVPKDLYGQALDLLLE